MNSPDITQIDPIWIKVGLAFIGVLLTIIAVFLKRLLDQFYELKDQFVNLNLTMVKIDGKVGSEIKLLSAAIVAVKEDVEKLDEVWDRLRKNEADINSIDSGGCKFYQRSCGGKT